MADNKSCEGKLTTLECMECGYREVFTERQFKCTDGLTCDVCNGPVSPTLTRPGEKIRNRRMKKRNGSLSLDIDCSDAIKGLKSVQREAKKATAALKELGNEQTKEHMLVIKLDEMGSVPKVFYKGEEVSNKINVGFNWETLTDKTDGRSDIRINYYVLDSVGKSTEKKIRESRNQS